MCGKRMLSFTWIYDLRFFSFSIGFSPKQQNLKSAPILFNCIWILFFLNPRWPETSFACAWSFISVLSHYKQLIISSALSVRITLYITTQRLLARWREHAKGLPGIWFKMFIKAVQVLPLHCASSFFISFQRSITFHLNTLPDIRVLLRL